MKFIGCKYLIYCGLVVCLVVGMKVDKLSAQFNHRYPRTGVFHWGGAPYEWYAQYDLVMSSSNSSNFAKNLKEINPNIIVVATRDINVGDPVQPNYYNEWTCVDSRGRPLTIYGGSKPLADITDFCPRVGGRRYNEAVADAMVNLVDLNYFDGIATDGLWDAPWGDAQNDIDLDRNGVNDNQEHGRDWVISQWKKGAGKVVTEINQKLPDDKIFIVNGTTLSGYRDQFNGHVFEYGGALSSAYHWGFGIYMDLTRELKQPHATMIDGCGAWIGESEDRSVRNNFELLRFVLGTALMGDGYVGYQTLYKDHYFLSYYDEFDLDLGYPTSDVQRIFENGYDAVFVRFFDNGVVILNAKGETVNISDNDIRSLSGYNGPYYRFQGNQDPQWNNGELFSGAVALPGRKIDSNRYWGECLILLREKKTVVADIVIDHSEMVTSPGSEPAELVGNWIQRCGGGNWSTGCREWLSGYEYAVTSGGSGEQYAIYRPTFGVPGKYEVYEWHGNHEGGVASNVPYEIHHAGGVTRGTINQTQNMRKWNLLGTFQFMTGKDNYIKISNAANGTVIADAFKFVYADKASQDSIPPNSPSNLQGMNISETSITLAWDKPPAASDGDQALWYTVYRNDNLITTTTNTSYEDNNLQESTSYHYAVYAFDDARNQSDEAATATFTTLADVTPPDISSVNSLSPTTVEIVFNEAVEKSSAITAINYSIEPDILIYSAELVDDSVTVQLATSEQIVGTTYNITINNVKDRAKIPNICSNLSAAYQAKMSPLVIRISADNIYELYVNGTFIGTDDNWNDAEKYTVQSNPDKNIIAVKVTDLEGVAGLVAEIDWGSKHFVTNENWKVSTQYQGGWETIGFNDITWQKATSIGYHGSTTPWTTFGDVNGIEKGTVVSWIWSSDNENDNEVYFRFTISGVDMEPPVPPSGLQVANPQ